MHDLLENQLRNCRAPDGQIDVTRLLAAVDIAYSRADEQTKRMFDLLGEGIVITTPAMVMTDVNSEALGLFGFERTALIGQPLDLLFEDAPVVGQPRQTRARHQNGDLFPIELTVTQADPERIIAVIRDITERRKIEADLHHEYEVRQNIIESLPGIFYMFDASGRFQAWNDNLMKITGRSRETMADAHPLDFFAESDQAVIAEAIQCALKTGYVTVEARLRTTDGRTVPYLFTGQRISHLGAPAVVGLGIDISERKAAEERINDLAFFDQLTGLPNRKLLLDRMRQAMAASFRSGSYGALLLIDLDNFKTLNETLGHDMGDLLLNQVASRLRTCVRQGDTVARWGGDEFVLMLDNLSLMESEAASQAEIVAEKILVILNKAYDLGGIAYRCSPSIGLTLFRGQQAALDDLLKQIDLAMYKAKAAGRNTLCFFDPTMESAVMARASMEADLRFALQANQFLLHYQPQVIEDGRVVGAEALVRWHFPPRGLISPAEFIPVAEETGMILALGEWVLEAACTRLARWATRPPLAALTVAVNVSARQFRQPNFVEQVVAVLNRTGAPPALLKLELTESLLVDNIQDIIEKMSALKAIGVGFSLDDFGTGYSSLTYLKRLPLDQLKIDQSFVRDVLTDPNDAAIARTIVALAQSLGLGVIAEGVETEAQRDFLAHAGCHAYQGYYFSRPIPADEFEAFVTRRGAKIYD